MTTLHTWIAVLSSSLITSAIAGLLAGTFALRAKSKDYVNDYYKQVLEKRWQAYQLVEEMIFYFKLASPDSQLRMVHFIFNSEDPEQLFTLIGRISEQAFWLSDDMFSKSRAC